MLDSIISFHQKWEDLGLKITFVLVSLQVIHLFWLTTYVVFNDPSLTMYVPPIVFVVIDYIEIPALISGVALYTTFIIRDRGGIRNVLLLGTLVVQAVHIFWITDAFILMSFKFNEMTWLAWTAVFIDYLELVVVWDLWKRIRRREVD